MTITRRWQCGFEARTSDEFTGGMTDIQGMGRSGSFSDRIPVNSGTATARYFYQNVPGTKQIRSGHAFNQAIAVGTVDGQYLVLRSAGANLVEIKIESDSDDLQLMVDGVQKDITTNSPMVPDVWTHLGVDCKIDAAAGWVYVYLNDVEVLSFDGDTGSDDIESVRYGSPDVQFIGSGYIYIDDCYIDDTTGEGAAAAVPVLRFFPVLLNGNGNYSQWTGSDGDSTNNYLLVDERPPSALDYVEESIVDQYDSYTMTSALLGSGQTAEAIILLAHTQRYGSGEQLAIGSRYSSTDVIGSNQTPSYGIYSYLWERQTTKPGGGAWDQASIDDFELVLKSRGSF